jgi:hypothetical protein
MTSLLQTFSRVIHHAHKRDIVVIPAACIVALVGIVLLTRWALMRRRRAAYDRRVVSVCVVAAGAQEGGDVCGGYERFRNDVVDKLRLSKFVVVVVPSTISAVDSMLPQAADRSRLARDNHDPLLSVDACLAAAVACVRMSLCFLREARTQAALVVRAAGGERFPSETDAVIVLSFDGGPDAELHCDSSKTWSRVWRATFWSRIGLLRNYDHVVFSGAACNVQETRRTELWKRHRRRTEVHDSSSDSVAHAVVEATVEVMNSRFGDSGQMASARKKQ